MQDLERFCGQLIRHAQGLGIQVDSPWPETVAWVHNNHTLEGAFTEMINKDKDKTLDLILVVIPMKGSPYYREFLVFLVVVVFFLLFGDRCCVMHKGVNA